MLSSMVAYMGPDKDTEWGDGDCAPHSVMARMPSFWPPHLALLCKGVPSPENMLSPAICLAWFLLCLFKECGCGRWLSSGSQDPEVTQFCVVQRAGICEGRHHPLPQTGGTRGALT